MKQRTFVHGLVVTAAGCASAFSTPALAADPGLYLGGGVGAYTLDIDDIEYDESAPLYRGFAGYRINDNWAIEADYQRLAEAEDEFLGTEVELDFQGYGVSIRPILPLGDAFDLYGKVGWTWYEAEADAAGFVVDDSDDDFTWGGGIDFHLGDLLTLRGEVTRIEVEETDLNLVSAALLLRF